LWLGPHPRDAFVFVARVRDNHRQLTCVLSHARLRTDGRVYAFHVNLKERVSSLHQSGELGRAVEAAGICRTRSVGAPRLHSETWVQCEPQTFQEGESSRPMAKIAKTGDRKKVMDTTKSTDCPKCSKPTRIVKRVKDRERGIPGGVYISCSACDFYEKL
jgi:hypothetical protein